MRASPNSFHETINHEKRKNCQFQTLCAVHSNFYFASTFGVVRSRFAGSEKKLLKIFKLEKREKKFPNSTLYRRKKKYFCAIALGYEKKYKKTASLRRYFSSRYWSRRWWNRDWMLCLETPIFNNKHESAEEKQRRGMSKKNKSEKKSFALCWVGSLSVSKLFSLSLCILLRFRERRRWITARDSHARVRCRKFDSTVKHGRWESFSILLCPHSARPTDLRRGN